MNQTAHLDLSEFSAPEVSLPILSEDQVEARNITSRRQMDGPLVLGGQNMAYYQKHDTDISPRLGTQVDLMMSGEPVSLYLDCDPRDLLPPLEALGVDLEQLDSEHLALLVEHVLSQEIEQLEQSWGCSIVLEDIVLERLFAPFDLIAGWRLDVAGSEQSYSAYLDARRRVPVAQHLASLFPERRRTSVAAMKTDVVFCAGICELPTADVQRLQMGAVLFPDQNWTAHRPVLQYLIWNRDIAPVVAVDGGLRLTAKNQKLEEIIRSQTRSISMNSGDATTLGTTQVTIELARDEMSFAELEQLCEGVIIDFQLPEIQMVTLSTGGKPIAKAQLVQLDNKIGVQIIEML